MSMSILHSMGEKKRKSETLKTFECKRKMSPLAANQTQKYIVKCYCEGFLTLVQTKEHLNTIEEGSALSAPCFKMEHKRT